MSTMRGPWRSATAPARGWMAPQVNWPMASAKLMVAMPNPVVSLSGATNRPCDWRMPIEIIMIPAAASAVIRMSGRFNARNMLLCLLCLT